MAKFKIIVVGLLLANNQMAKAGDFIDEKAFASPAEDLVKGGYIAKPTKAELEQIAKDEKASAASTDATEKAAKEAAEREAAEAAEAEEKAAKKEEEDAAKTAQEAADKK